MTSIDTELEADIYAYAIWMVGNMDTKQDKEAWWNDFQSTWDMAAKRVFSRMSITRTSEGDVVITIIGGHKFTLRK